MPAARQSAPHVATVRILITLRHPPGTGSLSHILDAHTKPECVKRHHISVVRSRARNALQVLRILRRDGAHGEPPLRVGAVHAAQRPPSQPVRDRDFEVPLPFTARLFRTPPPCGVWRKKHFGTPDFAPTAWISPVMFGGRLSTGRPPLTQCRFSTLRALLVMVDLLSLLIAFSRPHSSRGRSMLTKRLPRNRLHIGSILAPYPGVICECHGVDENRGRGSATRQ